MPDCTELSPVEHYVPEYFQCLWWSCWLVTYLTIYQSVVFAFQHKRISGSNWLKREHAKNFHFPPLLHSRVVLLCVFICALFLYLLQVDLYLKWSLFRNLSPSLFSFYVSLNQTSTRIHFALNMTSHCRQMHFLLVTNTIWCWRRTLLVLELNGFWCRSWTGFALETSALKTRIWIAPTHTARYQQLSNRT